MPRLVWECVLWLLVVGGPWCLARYRGRRNLAVILAVASVIFVSIFVIVAPDRGRTETAIAALGFAALDLGAWFVSAGIAGRLVSLARRKPAQVLVVCLGMSLVPLAITESTCRILTDCRVLSYHQGIQTVWRAGHDDWRMATITGDDNREPDPVLLWRPAPRKPYSWQRFKSPPAAVPKPHDVVRVICYGDSLTDGPPKGGWPTWLQQLLASQPPGPGRRVEVLNAGVAGYSSYQGLLRFLQEADRYDPDLLLVSFGWNDAAEAIGQPDNSFKLPPWPLIVAQRTLVRYRTYLVLMHYTRKWRSDPPVTQDRPVQSRVSVQEYLANLDRFRSEALSRGIRIMFLTRPHKLAPAELARNTGWRGSVPRYNAALVAWALEQQVPLLDVQRQFERLPSELFADECHFTPAGYRRMGELVCEALTSRPDGLLSLSRAPTKTATGKAAETRR